MEKTHIPEETQAKFQQCVEKAIAYFFTSKVNIKLACEMALGQIAGYRSAEVAVAETGQEIWFLLESETTTRLRQEVGLDQKDPIVQTVVAEDTIGKTEIGKTIKAGRRPE